MNARLTGVGPWSALLALPAVLLSGTPDPADEPAQLSASRFAWGDYDGDGLDDAYVILANGPARHGALLHNEGDGTLRDVTREAGLEGLLSPSFASWRDFDGDGALDLLVGTRTGGALFRNFGPASSNGTFEDVAHSSGLVLESGAEAAHWLDYDADGRADLHVRTRGCEVLFHGLGDGRFERAELPVATFGTSTTTAAGAAVDARPGVQTDTGTDGVDGGESGRGPGRATRTSAARGTLARATSGQHVVVTNPPGVQYVGSVPQNYACPDAIVDQADGVTCMQASSAPTLGLLYPISEDLFVASSGRVGIGTTAPGSRLHVIAEGADNALLSVGSPQVSAPGGKGATLRGGFGETTAPLPIVAFGGVGAEISGGDSASALSSTGGTGLIVDGGDAAGTGGSSAGGKGIVVRGGIGPNGRNLAIDATGDVVVNGGMSVDAGTLHVDPANNRLGVGTLSPSRTLDVNGSMVVDVDTFFVDEANDRVGVGTTSPDRKLHVMNGVSGTNPTTNSSLVVESSSEASISLIGPSNAEASVFFGNSVSGANAGAILFNPFGGVLTNGLVLRTSDSNRLAITSSGNVGIGTLSPTQLLSVNGTAGKPGGGSWSTFSDARLKKNVADLEHALDTLLALRGVTFEYEDPESIGELSGERIGFIAQEVEKVLPDWVEEGTGGYKQLTVRGFEALAVEALREQQATIERQAAELTGLREEMKGLRARVAGLESIGDEVAALRATLADR